MEERSVIIQDEHGNRVKELVVLWNHRIPWMCQFAIKKADRVYLIISHDEFNKIISTAEANGLYVFDFTDF